MIALNPEFLLTSLIVVLIPGTGVLYTVSTGLQSGRSASIAAAVGCTVGIVPSMTASIVGLAAVLHASSVAFQALRIVGVLYLLYLAWGLWRSSGALIDVSGAHDENPHTTQASWSGWRTIALKGALINTLNPKLSIFFLAFLPQFVPATAASAVPHMLTLGGTFMMMTFVVFVGYGAAADALRRRVLTSHRGMRFIQRSFAAAFALFAVKLATSGRQAGA